MMARRRRRPTAEEALGAPPRKRKDRSKFAGTNKAAAKARAIGRPGPHLTKTERNYGQRLQRLLLAGEIVWYAFEPMKFRLGAKCFYTPDYAVQLLDGTFALDEVKGSAGWQLSEDSRIKWKWAGEIYRPFRFRGVVERRGGGFLDPEEYKPVGSWPSMDELENKPKPKEEPDAPFY